MHAGCLISLVRWRSKTVAGLAGLDESREAEWARDLSEKNELTYGVLIEQ
jgi:hypothetical protein